MTNWYKKAGNLKMWDIIYLQGVDDTHIVNAVDSLGNIIGGGRFINKNEEIRIQPGGMIWVNTNFQRQGVATAILRKIEEVTGKKLSRPINMTGPGSKLFDNWFSRK